MPDLKHNFTQGRMNKDLDDRLVPNGEYRDAENVEIVTSDGSNVGAAQNLLGTTWQRIKTIDNPTNANAVTNWIAKFGYDTAECVGSIVDNDNNSIYWFIRGVKSTHTPTNTSLILQYSDKYKIIRPVLVDRNGVLNFQSGKKITGINILPAEGTGAESDQDNVMLFWTDNQTEPKKINVKVAMSGCTDTTTHTKYNGTIINSTTLAAASDFTEDNITVIKKSPLTAPSMVLSTSQRTGAGLVGSEVTAQYAFALTNTDGEIENYDDNSRHNLVFSVPPNWKDNSSGTLSSSRADKIYLEANYIDSVTNEKHKFVITARVVAIKNKGRTVKIEIVTIPSDYAEVVGLEIIEWKAWLIEDDPIYEFKFPRFAYRWRYRDGEVSCYSPFTEVAFKPGTLFDYDLEKGYNISMVNTIRSITLDKFTEKPNDVTEVEIVCKESNSNIVYLVETLKEDESSITIDSDIISHVIDEKQLLRHWDNVPKKSLAQEVTGNRIVYGNYLQNYTISKENQPDIGVDYSSKSITTLLNPEQSIKSIRNYQVGIVLKDKYGRETPVFTKSEVGFNIPIADCDKSNHILAKLNSSLPTWATHYKFFVKDPTNEYYNLVMDRYYDAEDGNVWVSFPSAERNKLQEGDYIVLKKQHNSDEPVTSDKAKYKILDIQNEVPDYIALKDTSVARVKVKTLSGGTDKPVVDGIGFGFIGPKATENPEFANAFQEGNKIQISDDNNVYASRIYEIENGGITYDSSSSGYSSGTTLAMYSVELKNPITADDDGFKKITFGGGTTFQISILQKEREILEEHHGRFFVKIAKDSLFKENVVANMPVVDKKHVVVHTQRIRDEAFKYNDALPDLGDGGYINRRNAKGWAEQDNSANQFESGIVFSWADTHGAIRGKHASDAFGGHKHDKMCSFLAWTWPMLPIPGGFDPINEDVDDDIPWFTKHVDSHTGKIGGARDEQAKEYAPYMGSPRPPTAIVDQTVRKGDNSNNFMFHIVGYPGGHNQKAKVDQHVNTNPFTAALKEGALIRFVVGLHGYDSNRDGTDDVVYKSQIYRVKKYTGTANPIHPVEGSAYYTKYVRNGIYREAYRRGTPDAAIAAGTNCPTAAANRDNWNATQTWIVYFEKLDGTEGFENSGDFYSNKWGTNGADGDGVKTDLSLKVTNDGLSGYRTIDPGKIKIDNKDTGGIGGEADGTRRNFLGPDYIEILDEVTEETNETVKSHNPGIWETEPKEDIDLEFYYEATDNIPTTIDTTTASQYIKVGVTVANVDGSKLQYPGKPHPIVSSVDGTTITLNEARTISKDTQLKLTSANGGAVTVTVASTTSTVDVVIKNTTIGEEIHFPYYNCFSYGNGVESNRIRDDFNQVMIDKGPKVSTTAVLPYNEERRSSGIIYSGIFNSTVGLNETNQFITALKITKDLNPEYGSIQRLHSRNTDLVTLCEDKVLKVLANKDALYNADGNINLTATENVLGQAVPFVGEFGISKNPESFCSYAFRAYFADKSRGAILRLSRDGLTNIAEKGMTSYFGLNLPASNLILGSFDENKQCYNLTHTSTSKGRDVTVSFDERVNGWTSFKSFVPENGCSLNNVYYTFKSANLFSHDNTIRNKFYDVKLNSNLEITQDDTTKDYETSIIAVLNESPSTIKQFKTLNYEGTQSREYTYAGTIGGTAYTGLSVERLRELNPVSGKQDNGSDFTVSNTKGWYCNSIQTNDQSGYIHEFKEKEGIWFNNIIGDTTALSNLDSQEFSVQGIDNASTISGAKTRGNLTVKLALTITNALDTAELKEATHTYPSTNTVSYVYGAALSGTRTLYIIPKPGYRLILTDFSATDPSGVTNTTLTKDGDNIKVVATLGGANFVSSGDQTITINIAGIGEIIPYTWSGSVDYDVDNVTNVSGTAHQDRTDWTGYWTSPALPLEGSNGERKLIYQEQFVAKKFTTGDYYTHHLEADKNTFEFISHADTGVNEPGGRYELITQYKNEDGTVLGGKWWEELGVVAYSVEYKLYFTFPDENTPVDSAAPRERFKITSKAIPFDIEGVNIRSWSWGSVTSNAVVNQDVPQSGDYGRKINVYGEPGAKYKLKQTAPDGTVTYLLGDTFTQLTMGDSGVETINAPVTANDTTDSKTWKYEITGDLEDPFEKDNPFYAYQYGSFDQTFKSSSANGLVLTAAADVVRAGVAYSEHNVDFTWTVTASGGVPMILGTVPTVDAPLFTNLDTNGFAIGFEDITATLNTAKTSLSIVAKAGIETFGTADNISILNIDSFISVNTAPITAAQAITAPVGSATNVTLALTSASQTAQTSEGDTLVFSIVSNGSKGTAAVTNTATGVGTYTPSATLFPLAATSDSYTFKCNDGNQDSNTSTVSVTIPVVSGNMDSRLSERFTGSGGDGSGYYVHRTAYCDGTTIKGSGGCDLNNLANKFIRVIQAHGVANVNGCETWNASTTYHQIVKVGIVGSTSYGISTQAYQNDPGDSNNDGTSMYPGAYMVGDKHYPTYNDALNNTNGTTC